MTNYELHETAAYRIRTATQLLESFAFSEGGGDPIEVTRFYCRSYGQQR